MNVKNLLILSLSSVVLSGCASLDFFGSDVKPLEVQTVAVEKTPLALAAPQPLNPKDVKWFVITPENYEQVFADLEAKKYSVVLYGLTDDGYENLSMNMAGLRKYIMEQRAIIKAYKDYYEPIQSDQPPETTK